MRLGIWIAYRYNRPMAQKYGTFLSMIDGHHIYLQCECGRQAEVPVLAMIEALGPEARLKDVAERSRCNGCGRRGAIAELRIFYKVKQT